MQTATTPDPARTFAERILTELGEMREDLDSLKMQVSMLNECASLLLRPIDEGDESPLGAMMRLMNLLVGGTEQTHKHLEAMNSALFDRSMTSALRIAMDD